MPDDRNCEATTACGSSHEHPLTCILQTETVFPNIVATQHCTAPTKHHLLVEARGVLNSPSQCTVCLRLKPTALPVRLFETFPPYLSYDPVVKSIFPLTIIPLTPIPLTPSVTALVLEQCPLSLANVSLMHTTVPTFAGTLSFTAPQP